MNSDYRGYDSTNPKSIEDYAKRLVNKTFMDIVEESHLVEEDSNSYSNALRKGGLGNLLEDVYFGYGANSNQEADFPDAGLELKVTPYEVGKNGELRAGERLVLTMINYNGPIEEDFYKSHAWEKMRLILLVYYCRNKQLNNNLLYKIGYVKMFTPPDDDLAIIKRDYSLIIGMIEAGKAHELSERLTMYLGAATKGATAIKSTVPQYYGNKTPAKKRAFCFKTSYMTFVLNHYVVGKKNDNAIIKNSKEIKDKSFADVLNDIVSKYIGMSDKELCEQFGRDYNNNKAQWNDLAYKILGIRNEHADEFEKANIRVKTIRVDENDRMRESMSFPPFKFMDLVKEEYDDSTLHNYFDETQLFFFVWKKDGDVYRVKGCALWHMPSSDLDVTVKREWELYRNTIKDGVEFKRCNKSNGSVSFENNLPKKTDTEIIHIRPHATKSAYKFLNGEEIGNVQRDANILPNGEYMTTQSFWINNTYILKQIEQLL